MASTLINGTSYSWAQITINIQGTPLYGVTAISYSETQEKTNNYGQGSNPTSRGRGRKEYEASMTIRLGELEALRNSIASRNLVDIPVFDVTVAFIPKGSDSNVPVVHTLKNAEFLSDSVDVTEGDTSIEVDTPLIISEIIRESL
jgi:hypothetical protein